MSTCVYTYFLGVPVHRVFRGGCLLHRILVIVCVCVCDCSECVLMCVSGFGGVWVGAPEVRGGKMLLSACT